MYAYIDNAVISFFFFFFFFEKIDENGNRIAMFP